MRTSWKVGSMLLLAAAGLMLLGAPGRVEARPQYQKQFNEKYSGLKEESAKQKCNVCHYGTGENAKKNRNNYGKDLAEALGGKNVKDADKIKKALEEVESKESAEKEKSYKDLIDAGQLPSSGWKQPDSN